MIKSVVAAMAIMAFTVPNRCTAEENSPTEDVVAPRGQFQPLTEPPCSYCITQHRKGLIQLNDRAVVWLRGVHNGGAIPLRHFLSGPRVINDTYGLFFYDPDGGYVAAYAKDYGYKLHGWRRGVMVVEGPDGSLWSALRGVAIEGPKKGQRLRRIPSMVTEWGYWLMLHPESTAYDLFDGTRYSIVRLPRKISQGTERSLASVDPRLPPLSSVLGVEFPGQVKAYPLDEDKERVSLNDVVAGMSLAVFWYKPTRTAVAFSSELDGQNLTFYADGISPDTAPFKDRETGTRWSLAGRGIDGPLRGKELRWISSIQCRWYAWVAEYPESPVHSSPTE